MFYPLPHLEISLEALFFLKMKKLMILKIIWSPNLIFGYALILVIFIRSSTEPKADSKGLIFI